MLKLTDAQLTIVRSAAEPLQPRARALYLEMVSELLDGHAEIGDGTVARAAAMAQKRYLDPPRF